MATGGRHASVEAVAYGPEVRHGSADAVGRAPGVRVHMPSAIVRYADDLRPTVSAPDDRIKFVRRPDDLPRGGYTDGLVPPASHGGRATSPCQHGATRTTARGHAPRHLPAQRNADHRHTSRAPRARRSRRPVEALQASSSGAVSFHQTLCEIDTRCVHIASAGRCCPAKLEQDQPLTRAASLARRMQSSPVRSSVDGGIAHEHDVDGPCHN
jgi:hypothetical protein